MKTKLIVLAALLAPLFACGPVQDSSEPDGELGSVEGEIKYLRSQLRCRVKGTQEDIDTPAFDLKPLAFGATYTFANEPIPNFAPVVPPEWGKPQVETLFRFKWYEPSSTAAPLPFLFSDKMKAAVPHLAQFELNGPGINPTQTLVFKERLDNFSLYDIVQRYDQFDISAATAGGQSYLLAKLIPQRAVSMSFSKSETDALLLAMGAKGPIPAALPSLGNMPIERNGFDSRSPDDVWCSNERQLHVPPADTNGVSFHVKLCCNRVP